MTAINPLRAYRKSKGIRINQMAGMLGISSASLSRIERGDQWPGTAEFFKRLAEITSGAVTANDFVDARGAPEAAA